MNCYYDVNGVTRMGRSAARDGKSRPQNNSSLFIMTIISMANKNKCYNIVILKNHFILNYIIYVNM